MRRLHLIMPMAGGGTRFAGFEFPKPLIEIEKKPFFYWATKSLYIRRPLSLIKKESG